MKSARSVTGPVIAELPHAALNLQVISCQVMPSQVIWMPCSPMAIVRFTWWQNVMVSLSRPCKCSGRNNQNECSKMLINMLQHKCALGWVQVGQVGIWRHVTVIIWQDTGSNPHPVERRKVHESSALWAFCSRVLCTENANQSWQLSDTTCHGDLLAERAAIGCTGAAWHQGFKTVKTCFLRAAVQLAIEPCELNPVRFIVTTLWVFVSMCSTVSATACLAACSRFWWRET